MMAKTNWIAALALVALATVGCKSKRADESQVAPATPQVPVAPLPASTTTVTNAARVETMFDVAGMHCAMCPVTVRTAARAVPGVTDARVSMDEARAWVTYDPTLTTPERIAAAISEAGYPTKARAP